MFSIIPSVFHEYRQLNGPIGYTVLGQTLVCGSVSEMLTWHQHLSEQILPKGCAHVFMAQALVDNRELGKFVSRPRLDPSHVDIPGIFTLYRPG